MKLIKYLLYFSLILIVLGFIGNSVILINGAKSTLKIGVFALFIFVPVYFIISIIKKRERIFSGMIMLAEVLILGVLFKLMGYPGGGVFVVIGSQLVLIGSVGILIYSFTKKRNVEISVAYLAIGFCALFFCFKVQFWPDFAMLMGTAGIGILIGTIYMVKKKKVIMPRSIIIFLIYGFTCSLFFTSPSQILRFLKIELTQSETDPENFYNYSWELYKEGKHEAALENLDKAIYEVSNENNSTHYRITDIQDVWLERYLRAKKKVLNENWEEIEYPKVFPNYN